MCVASLSVRAEMGCRCVQDGARLAPGFRVTTFVQLQPRILYNIFSARASIAPG
jgi:hypothetical protein